jgi:large subunit ribosomal protein L21
MAYAIVETGGLQFQVKAQDVLEIPRLAVSEGETVTLDRVLFYADGDDVRVGRPRVEGAAVEAKVLEHVLGPKVLIYKQKRRKTYRKKRGHRQPLTRVEVTALRSGA